MYLIQRKNSMTIFRFLTHHYFERCAKNDFFIRYLKKMPIHQWYQFNENDWKNADDRNDLACSVTSHNSVRRNLFRLARVPRHRRALITLFATPTYSIIGYRLASWFQPFANWLQDLRRYGFATSMVQRINEPNGLDLSRNVIMIDTPFKNTREIWFFFIYQKIKSR